MRHCTLSLRTYALIAGLACALMSCGATQPETEVRGPGPEPTSAPTARPKASGARPATRGDLDAPLVIQRPALERVLAAGPGRLLQQVPIEPVFAPGHKFAGFRILALFGDDPKVLRYGVLPGDVLHAVNGQRIVTPSDLMTAFERLRGADVLEVSVQRAGIARTFRFPVVPPIRAP